MKRNANTSKLTKAFIESRVSQEEIVSKYLDIPLEVVRDCVEHNHLITSVFRDDDTDGSMGIAYNAKGRLKVRDFGGSGFFDDVYGVVAYVLSIVYERPISTNNKQDFYFVLSHIYRTFSYEIDNHVNDYNVDESIKNALVKARNKKSWLFMSNINYFSSISISKIIHRTFVSIHIRCSFISTNIYFFPF